MKTITLGSTGITTIQNAFGALPIQRVSIEEGIKIIQKAYYGGIRFFDTARAYSDSELKLGLAFENIDRKDIFIATKTMAKTPEQFWEQLNTSLELLKTDYIDIYQFHCASQVYKPHDGTGMYECMLEAKAQGKIKHIGITAHLLQVAFDAVESGLYETLQFPFSYLSSEKEIELVKLCQEKNMGFIAMKGLAGGLINQSNKAMAYMTQYDNVLPIWGIQKESELDEWLSYINNTPTMTKDIIEYIEKEKEELSGEFCRGCGYCMPCPAGIMINQCARMSLMLRRAPSAAWLTEDMQSEMKKIENCLHCNLCHQKCPYGLDTPKLLEKNYEDYQKVLSGEVKV
ncbi:MAG: aldo/keto reductase [Erysipelotrichales bacterium]|nr:aldo/keto reductase [Erysipelotrichales bacterium]